MKHVGNLVLGVIAVAFNAWTVTMLWSWFACAVFGLPAISIAAVIGISLLINTFTFNPYRWTFNEKESSQASLETIMVSVVALLGGWLVHLAM